MTKTCHGFQFVACHDLKRGKYKEALQSFWRALQERIFKDSVYVVLRFVFGILFVTCCSGLSESMLGFT